VVDVLIPLYLIKCIVKKHNPKAKRLYKEYKKLCARAKCLDIEEIKEIIGILDKIKFLNKYYCTHKAAYEARMEHRNSCIVPCCRDYGHDMQFILIKEKINICENQLIQLYTLLLEEKKEEITTSADIKDIENKEEDTDIIEEIKTFRQKRVNDEKETNRVIGDYIKKNKVILKEKKEAIDKIYSELLRFIPKDTKHIYYLMICMIFSVLAMIHLIKTKIIPSTTYTKEISLFFTHRMIKKYNNIRDHINEQLLGEILCMSGILNSRDELTSDVLRRVVIAWEKSNVDPDLSFFLISINKGGFTYHILKK
jgi:hypothetical protein